MTMVPDNQNIIHGGYAGGGCGGGGSSLRLPDGFVGLVNRLEGYGHSWLIGSDLMAEDESRTDQTHGSNSSSKEVIGHQEEKDHENWLQLSIGGGHTSNYSTTQEQRESLELDLLTGGRGNNNTSSENITTLSRPMFFNEVVASRPLNPMLTTAPPAAAFFFQQPGLGGGGVSSFPRQQDSNLWGFGGGARNLLAAASSSASFYPRPFQVQSGNDFRVIEPPRRPHSGIWFMLQPALNQTKEPFLPQLSKSYLRLKDGRITIRLVLKYLVNKLKLENESEIEIRCRGQQVEPLMTVQQVRDSLWRTGNPRELLTLFPHSSPLDHIMVLHYARIT